MSKANCLSFFKKLSLSAVVLLSGCSMAVLDPKGQVGEEQKYLILTSTWLMLIVVVPAIVMAILFTFKYHHRKQAKYSPDWAHSNKIEAVVWGVPCLIILTLGILTWQSSHALNPSKMIESGNEPMTVKVVALDWKWLFIYPEQRIATVNQLALPVDVPVRFEVTSNSVMNSFFIPRLGSQIYAMAGMQNTLHLIANEAGSYYGMSANYSGAGFSEMNFEALAIPLENFDEWVDKVRQSPQVLQWSRFEELAEPSIDHDVEYFSSVKPHLFQDIIDQFVVGGVSMNTGDGE